MPLLTSYLLYLLFCPLTLASPEGLWLGKQATPVELYASISRYDDLSDSFIHNLTPWMRRRITYLSTSAFNNFQSGKCASRAYFKVFTADTAPFQLSDKEAHFVNSIFRVESSHCLTNTTIDKVYKTYMSPDYRLDVMPRLGHYTHSPKETCVGTNAVTGVLKPSSYCLATSEKRLENAIITHSILKTTNKDDAFQQVYYREEVLVIVKVSPETVGIYRVTFTRSADLGMTSKFLIQSTVDSAQKDIYAGLERWIRVE